MTEDKDLMRAEQVTRKLVYTPDSFGAQKENSMPQGNWNERNIEIISSALKEERRRLLDDPRIKELMRTSQALYGDFKSDTFIRESIPRFPELGKAISDFESLLKENEEG